MRLLIITIVERIMKALFISTSQSSTRCLHQPQPLPPSQLLPFSAACPASYPFEWLSDVVSGNGYLFAAAFEGIGGAAAAQHCHQHAHEALVAGLAAGMDADRGLRAMWQELDRSYLAGPLPDPVGPFKLLMR